MQNGHVVKIVDAAADLADRYGPDAIVIARRLAQGGGGPEVTSFWASVSDLFTESEAIARTLPD